MKDLLELHEFFVEGDDQKKSHVLLHITEPSTPEEQKKGYLFALAEIEGGSTEQIERVQQMIDDLESGYYETEDEGERSAFEITLEYLNRRGHHILNYDSATVHCIVGVVGETGVSFAFHGAPIALLFYSGKQGYAALNLLEGEDAQKKTQLFSELMQGQIQTGDYFFAGTPHVADYLSQDRMQKIMTSRPTRQGVTHIQKVLANLRSNLSFGGILFYRAPKDQIPKTGKMPVYLKQGSAESIGKLMRAEQTTSETLHPPLFGNAAKSVKNFLEKRREASPEAEPPKRAVREKTKEKEAREVKTAETNYRPRAGRREKEPIWTIILVALGKAMVALGQVVFFIGKRIVIVARNILVALFILATNKSGQRQTVVNQMRRSVKRRKDAVVSLPIMSKILLGATVIFAVIFVGSIVFLKTKEAREARDVAYQNLIAAIGDKKDAAEASMIYGDDAKAFELLKEAEAIARELPLESDEQEIKARELAADIESSLTTFRKIIVVSPQALDLTEVRPDAAVNRLVAIDKKIIAYGNDQGLFYIADQITGAVDVKQSAAIPELFAASTPKENDFTIFASGPDTIAQLDKTAFTLTAKDISFPRDGTQLADVFVYNRRLYTLDTANSQIYKHNPTQTGYDRGAPWIKTADADLSDAVSLALDGDVFVLKQNGAVLKFVGGDLADFALHGVDPALENPIALWTYNDVDNIYILEPAGKRVVVVSKEGRLVQQYTHPDWQAPTGMVVDEANKTIFVLDSNKIYKFNTSQ
ncbi:MAG: hypothetical protein A3C90_00545 [Candidatus Magasanikbacteria bacterium RIFCSPHIGHO2_02_FULL_51_14]|uniref:Uncharacterized protein n=1 Tax=Candidatus Magasanikbacteria bacterium RIFCSPHIGHO2_02_FULL_51_14 TaxID=1798683 RepID=A0A1F6MHG1_9BACT|nr:MAG: hypothetical protein A3C90_00545 [Candidatus Magasanikbacteria bacterium RIFCSPHIGHO2_02_FULL_51_14]